MADGLTPVRRVVTGTDERGRSRVVWDGYAPNIHGYGKHKSPLASGSGWTNLWAFDECPPPLAGEADDGNKPYEFPADPYGAHWRVVQYRAPKPDYDLSADVDVVPLHEPRKRAVGRTWDRGGNNAFSSSIHKTESVDYGFLIEGERILVLDECELLMKPGDVVVQLGNWHGWKAVTDCRMAFVMMSASFDAELHSAQSAHVLEPRQPPADVTQVRRIVTGSGAEDQSILISDGPSPDIHTDPARPGFASTRIWITDSTPARIKGVRETLASPSSLEPPSRGSVCRVVTFPPDRVWSGRVGAKEVHAYFDAAGSPEASTYSAQAPHAYMQKTSTLDFCLVLSGEICLVLDTQEVKLGTGDIVVQRGTNHAWSNRSAKPAVLALVSHDATEDGAPF